MSVDQPIAFVKYKPQKQDPKQSRIEGAGVKCTVDAFLAGKLSILQPTHGFRAGVDSVLLGASVSPNTSSVLDLGAGVGVAALCVAHYNSSARLTLVEQDTEISRLSVLNIERNNLGERTEALLLNIYDDAQQQVAAGLKRDHYSTVIANPPYFAQGTKSVDVYRAAARHMEGDEIDLWVKAACTAGSAKAEIIFVQTIAAFPQTLLAFTKRLGNITVLPIVSRPDQSASRFLIRGTKGSKAPFAMLSPLVLHEAEGNHFTQNVDAIFKGNRPLEW